MKVHAILNPHSGRLPRRRGLRDRLTQTIAAWPVEVGLSLTEGPGHALTLARQAVADGCSRIIAIGGDGTVNEIAQALVHQPVELGLVPLGSGNGLARHLGLPMAPLSALQLALSASSPVREIDSGAANGHPFFNIMGLGFDAEVGREFNRRPQRGPASYLAATLAAFAASRPQTCVIQAGAVREQLELLWIAAANSDQYGNNAVIAPGARCDDGVLDLVAVRPVGWVGAAQLATRVFLRNFDRSRAVRRWRGTAFVVERPAPGLIHTDGELHEAAARVEISLAPRSLRIVTAVNGKAPG